MPFFRLPFYKIISSILTIPHFSIFIKHKSKKTCGCEPVKTIGMNIYRKHVCTICKIKDTTQRKSYTLCVGWQKIKKSNSKELDFLAAELGFEPRQTESESAVLPLHNSASTPYIIAKEMSFVNSFFEICLLKFLVLYVIIKK